MNQGLPYFHAAAGPAADGDEPEPHQVRRLAGLSLCERQEALAMMHRRNYDRRAASIATPTTVTVRWASSPPANGKPTSPPLGAQRLAGGRGDFGGVEREGLLAALRHHGHADAVVIGPESMHYSFTKASGPLGVGEPRAGSRADRLPGRMDLAGAARGCRLPRPKRPHHRRRGSRRQHRRRGHRPPRRDRGHRRGGGRLFPR